MKCNLAWHPRSAARMRISCPGGGQLLDYEYLVDNHGQRVTSFGVPAGMVGMATGVLAWCRQLMEGKVKEELLDNSNKLPLLEHVKSLLELAKAQGARGVGFTCGCTLAGARVPRVSCESRVCTRAPRGRVDAEDHHHGRDGSCGVRGPELR